MDDRHIDCHSRLVAVSVVEIPAVEMAGMVVEKIVFVYHGAHDLDHSHCRVSVDPQVGRSVQEFRGRRRLVLVALLFCIGGGSLCLRDPLPHYGRLVVSLSEPSHKLVALPLDIPRRKAAVRIHLYMFAVEHSRLRPILAPVGDHPVRNGCHY